MISRRFLLGVAPLSVAAPSIVRATSLMPISPLKPVVFAGQSYNVGDLIVSTTLPGGPMFWSVSECHAAMIEKRTWKAGETAILRWDGAAWRTISAPASGPASNEQAAEPA